MFTRYTNGAEQEVNSVYRYANGAEQKADAIYRYVNGAEQKVWSAARYFLKAGTLMTGASLSGMAFRQGSGNIYLNADEDTGYQNAALALTLTSDMVGKKVYVKASSNIYANSGNPHLEFTYPISANNVKQVPMTTKNSDGFLVVTIPSDYYFDSSNQPYTTLYLANDYGIPTGTYYIYDVYVA